MKKITTLLSFILFSYFLVPVSVYANTLLSDEEQIQGVFVSHYTGNISYCTTGVVCAMSSYPPIGTVFSSPQAALAAMPYAYRVGTSTIYYPYLNSSQSQVSVSAFVNSNHYIRTMHLGYYTGTENFSSPCDFMAGHPEYTGTYDCNEPDLPPDFRFPPGSPFCIDNPTSPLCVDEVPDGCNIGLGTGDCCTAFATNQCAGNGGVYWVNFTSGDFGESCTYECWGDQHNHPPEPDPGNHPGFPDRQACETFANNHCNGSGNVHMLLYNEDTKTCSVTCSDGRGGTSPDPTVPIPGTNPGQTPSPGETTDLGVQRAIQRFHGDFNIAAGRTNQLLDNIDLNVSAQTGLLDDISGLLEEIRDKPTPGFDGELTIPGFDNLPGDFGGLDHDGDDMRGIGDGLGLDGDTTFADIPERIIDITDHMGNFDLPSAGSCPTSFPVPLFGQVYNLDTSHMCRILEIVSIFLMMSAYVLSLRIVYGGLR